MIQRHLTWGGTKWKGRYTDMQLRTVALFAPQVLRLPLIFLKIGLDIDTFFIFAFSLRIRCKKMVNLYLSLLIGG